MACAPAATRPCLRRRRRRQGGTLGSGRALPPLRAVACSTPCRRLLPPPLTTPHRLAAEPPADGGVRTGSRAPCLRWQQTGTRGADRALPPPSAAVRSVACAGSHGVLLQGSTRIEDEAKRELPGEIFPWYGSIRTVYLNLAVGSRSNSRRQPKGTLPKQMERSNQKQARHGGRR